MPTAFRRPVLATVFYFFGTISIAASFVAAYWYYHMSPGVFARGLSLGFASVVLITCLIQCAFYLALGYGIEKLAKIEWNTRPENLRASSLPGDTSVVSRGKSFYVTSSGQTLGPLNAQGLLNLYRDGKLTHSSQILAEENGYRRTVTDWSEFGL